MITASPDPNKFLWKQIFLSFFVFFEETPYKKKLTKYSKSFVTAATLFKRNSWINEAL